MAVNRGKREEARGKKEKRTKNRQDFFRRSFYRFWGAFLRVSQIGIEPTSN
jgi:hypothetical protein